MSKRISNSKKRRLEILKKASENPWGILLNVKWCFAFVQEPAMKWLLKRNMIVLKRSIGGPSKRNNVTLGIITKEGYKYLNKIN